jgi:GTP cyclohydrolase I
MDMQKIEAAVRSIIEAIGENPERKGIKETPKRVAKMYCELFKGLSESPEKVLGKVFYEDFNELVLVKDIPFFSICEHHMLPFYGKAHVAYLPDNRKVVGISKIVRLVEVFSRRMQLQERITNQVADAMMKILTPQGTMVVIEAEHMCMGMRGVQRPGTKIVTSAMRGIFLKDFRTRTEALNLILPSRS